jgi:hypothetical protein
MLRGFMSCQERSLIRAAALRFVTFSPRDGSPAAAADAQRSPRRRRVTPAMILVSTCQRKQIFLRFANNFRHANEHRRCRRADAASRLMPTTLRRRECIISRFDFVRTLSALDTDDSERYVPVVFSSPVETFVPAISKRLHETMCSEFHSRRRAEYFTYIFCHGGQLLKRRDIR